MSAQTLGFAVHPEDRPLLEELVAYFGDGNRSAYLRATLRVMRSVMLADQLRDLQAYGQQRTAELGIESADVAARVQEFLKDSAGRGE
jgi:enoyl-CoA hydratase/carnithine racemase